jgi:CobQ-like glutamine amidotransferase family enzyme
MNIEILYPEYCNLYGDTGNTRFLQTCIPDGNFIFTGLNDIPHFCNNPVNLIYLAPTTESCQEEIIELFMPYKEKIAELIDNNVVFLATGNALEIFGKYIQRPDGSKIEALGIFDIYSIRGDNDRFNELELGKFGELEIVGFKNQLSFSYGNNEKEYFLEMIKGSGINPQTRTRRHKEK